jgi:chemotaxis response regulator CheB
MAVSMVKPAISLSFEISVFDIVPSPVLALLMQGMLVMVTGLGGEFGQDGTGL